MIIPVAIVIVPSVTPLIVGWFNVMTNSSSISTMLSIITGTLTLIIDIPLANVAVSGAVLKSTSPVSQTLFSQHIIIHTMLPSADTGDCSDGVTVTSNGVLDVPPVSCNSTSKNSVFSIALKLDCVNSTIIPKHLQITLLNTLYNCPSKGYRFNTQSQQYLVI